MKIQKRMYSVTQRRILSCVQEAKSCFALFSSESHKHRHTGVHLWAGREPESVICSAVSGKTLIPLWTLHAVLQKTVEPPQKVSIIKENLENMTDYKAISELRLFGALFSGVRVGLLAPFFLKVCLILLSSHTFASSSSSSSSPSSFIKFI